MTASVAVSKMPTTLEYVPVLCCCDPDNVLGYVRLQDDVKVRKFEEYKAWVDGETGEELERVEANRMVMYVGYAYGSDDLGITQHAAGKSKKPRKTKGKGAGKVKRKSKKKRKWL